MRPEGPQPLMNGFVACAFFGAAMLMAKALPVSDPVVLFAIAILVLCGVISILKMALDFVRLFFILLIRRAAMRPEKIHGTARFANKKDLRK